MKKYKNALDLTGYNDMLDLSYTATIEEYTKYRKRAMEILWEILDDLPVRPPLVKQRSMNWIIRINGLTHQELVKMVKDKLREENPQSPFLANLNDIELF